MCTAFQKGDVGVKCIFAKMCKKRLCLRPMKSGAPAGPRFFLRGSGVDGALFRFKKVHFLGQI